MCDSGESQDVSVCHQLTLLPSLYSWEMLHLMCDSDESQDVTVCHTVSNMTSIHMSVA